MCRHYPYSYVHRESVDYYTNKVLCSRFVHMFVCMNACMMVTFVFEFNILHAGKSRMTFGKRVPIRQDCIEQAKQVCEVYLHLLSTMVQISSDLLVGLCCNEVLLSKMWSFLKESSALQMKPFVNMQSPLRSVLLLFCQVMQYMLG